MANIYFCPVFICVKKYILIFGSILCFALAEFVDIISTNLQRRYEYKIIFEVYEVIISCLPQNNFFFTEYSDYFKVSNKYCNLPNWDLKLFLQ